MWDLIVLGGNYRERIKVIFVVTWWSIFVEDENMRRLGKMAIYLLVNCMVLSLIYFPKLHGVTVSIYLGKS